MQEGERRLAAIMFTDMVGYTALTESDESLAMEVLERHNRLLRPIFARFRGKEIKTIGDSFLVEFDSALDAVKCGVEIQSYLHDYNVSSKDEWRIKLRIGIHLGDVIHQRGDVFGDAVNIASRIEPLARSEGICVSEQVFDQVHDKFELPMVSLGEKSLKNVGKSIGVFGVGMPWEEKQQSAPLDTRRIAVMPFANMSRDPGDEYFADGMTEELISSISNISGLSVISRTSVMKFKAGGKTVSEIGQELKAGTLLEGSVRKADNMVRVAAQLIDVNTDRHLWSQKYDRELKNIFAVQSDIATQVADALRVRMLAQEIDRIERRPTENATAYSLYLRGRYHWNRRSVEEVKKAMGYFEKAIGEDAKFALGYVGLADCHMILANNYLIEVTSNNHKAEKLLGRALQLDPGLPEAHASRGLALLNANNLREAEDEFREAIRLKPNYASAHQWYYHLLITEQRWDEALKQIEKAVELDPLAQMIGFNQANYYELRRDFAKALDLYRKASELDPKFATPHIGLFHVYGRMKRFDEMRREADVIGRIYADTFPQDRRVIEAETAYFEGDKAKVRELLPDLEAHIRESPGSSYGNIAGLYFFIGDYDKGFELLERAVAVKEVLSPWLQVHEYYDDIRSDPRYHSILKKIGLD